MNSTHCEACGHHVDGRPIDYLFYLQNAEANARKYVTAVQCQYCDALFCAEGSSEDHPKMSWWSGWEKVPCPSCQKPIGPGAMIVSQDAPEIVDPSIKPLLLILEDESRAVLERAKAAVALGQSGDAIAVSPLMTLLADESEHLRQAAEYALFDIGAPAVDSLVAALNGPSLTKRRAAARILGQIGDKRALQPLSSMMDRDDERLRKTAAIALNQIGAQQHLNL